MYTPLAMQFCTIFILVAILQGTASYEEEGKEVDLTRPLYPTPIIDLINGDPSAGWTAGVTEQFINYTFGDLKKMGGAILDTHSTTNLTDVDPQDTMEQLPVSFDARSMWNCPSMQKILDQGQCGACWAFSTVQALQDRFCINYGLDLALSVQHVLSCCGSCGSCDGGNMDKSFEYMSKSGTVSRQCSPYFDTSRCRTSCTAADTPKCMRRCEDQEDWSTRYYSSMPYSLPSIPQAMREIANNGPIVAGFDIYQDFMYYKSGIYRHIQGQKVGAHAVKLVGWGVSDQGEKYWIATNQWGSKWGENGHFKIAMGVNECQIESYLSAAKPVKPQVG